VRKWIAQYLGSDPAELFDPGMQQAEPIIFNMGDGQFLELRLAVVPADFEHALAEMTKKKEVQHAIEFLAYAANIVFMTTLKTLETGDAHDILMAWDPRKLTYTPTYSPPKLREFQLCNHMLSQLGKGCQDAEKKDAWVAEYKKYQTRALELKEPVLALEQVIRAKNEELSTLPRISITSRVIGRHDLPGNTYTRHLKPVADVQFEDC